MDFQSISNIDLERLRADTPGVKERLHFNNAGAALVPKPVLDAVISHLELEAKIGGYEAAEAAEKKIEHVYDALAELINCHRNEIATVENATRAWDMVFYSLPFRTGDRILTAMSEYASNYIAFLQMKKLRGVIIDVVPNDQFGQIDLGALKDMVNERVKLIAITHVPTNGGLVNPASEVGKVAKSAEIPYLLDACQSIGQMPIDVEEIGCDMLCGTGRKYLRGPRGTGFLYVRKKMLEILEPPFLDLHSAEWVSQNQYVISPDARRFETWETYYAGKIGLGVAVDYALSWGLDAIEERVVTLANRLRGYLSQIPGVKVQDQGQKQCGIVTFTVLNLSADDLKEKLGQKQINVSVSKLAYGRLYVEARGLGDLVRASVHYYNTQEEVERFCRDLEQIVS